MKWLLERLLRRMGPAKLLRMFWDIIHPRLEEWAQSTDPEWDDALVAFLDDVVEKIVSKLGE